MLPMYMKPGTLVVFEGPDGTGKSTQLERWERSCYAPEMGTPFLSDPLPMFTHQPSGASGIGPDIYSLTESVDWSKSEGLTRQLLHLAAHTEHYAHDIIPALKERPVFMDRCWWSTVAYGFNQTELKKFGLNYASFELLAQRPTQGYMPDVVFLFTERVDRTKLAEVDDKVQHRYLTLAEDYSGTTVMIPKLGVGDTTAFISAELFRRGLITKKKENS